MHSGDSCTTAGTSLVPPSCPLKRGPHSKFYFVYVPFISHSVCLYLHSIICICLLCVFVCFVTGVAVVCLLPQFFFLNWAGTPGWVSRWEGARGTFDPNSSSLQDCSGDNVVTSLAPGLDVGSGSEMDPVDASLGGPSRLQGTRHPPNANWTGCRTGLLHLRALWGSPCSVQAWPLSRARAALLQLRRWAGGTAADTNCFATLEKRPWEGIFSSKFSEALPGLYNVKDRLVYI